MDRMEENDYKTNKIICEYSGGVNLGTLSNFANASATNEAGTPPQSVAKATRVIDNDWKLSSQFDIDGNLIDIIDFIISIKYKSNHFYS